MVKNGLCQRQQQHLRTADDLCSFTFQWNRKLVRAVHYAYDALR